MRFLFSLLILASLLSYSSCDDDGGGSSTDNFDRAAMLLSWADQVILPAYADFLEKSSELQTSAQALFDEPDATTLAALKSSFAEAYLGWQSISLFQIGPAEQVGLREQVNAYPTNTDGIEANMQSGSYNFELPSQRSRQGFPALDYLLYGSAADETAVLDRIVNEAALREYILATSERIHQLVSTVRETWVSSYRQEFVSLSDNTATSSVNRMTNDYVFYYEKFLRAGKVGIPAGIFSGTPLPGHVEALYNKALGKQLLLAALESAQGFFNGLDNSGVAHGNGFTDYLDFLNTVKDGADLSQLINTQFEAARQAINNLDDDLSDQVREDNLLMLTAYDELQRNVVLIKVDMLQAFNISVDFVDADGD
ncbi:MAG: imelysin family protein [Bacteroidota bacterium]